MRYEEHIQTAREFLGKSDRYFADGDRLQGSEKLWGAAAHAVLAAARIRGMRLGRHSRLREMADSLSREMGEPLIAADFDSAERFHANFYHGYMSDYDLALERPAAGAPLTVAARTEQPGRIAPAPAKNAAR